MIRNLSLLIVLGIAASGATASAQTIVDNDRSAVAVDASRDNNQDNDTITTNVNKQSTEKKIVDSFQDNRRSTVKTHDESRNLSNVLNGLSKPMAENELKAKVSGNRVLTVAQVSSVGNVNVKGSFTQFKGINSMNSNTGANAIQQSAVAVSTVTHTSY